jgi:hypothetical protein
MASSSESLRTTAADFPAEPKAGVLFLKPHVIYGHEVRF